MEKRRKKILIIDDEAGICGLLSEVLQDEGYAAVTAQDAETAGKVREAESPDLILLDIWMPDMDGIALMRQWMNMQFDDNAIIVVMSGHATIDNAVEATKLGAFKVLEKPIPTEVLLSAVKKALLLHRPPPPNRYLQHLTIGASEEARKLKEDLLAAAVGNGPVLMVGPASAGAAFFARYIVSPKKDAVVLDSADLQGRLDKLLPQSSGDLIIVPAVQGLDHIQQNGLLGLLREAKRLGVRVVAGSTLPPAALQSEAGFSKTLTDMLSSNVIRLPALTPYQSDIPDLATMVCRHFCRLAGCPDKQWTPEAMRRLSAHTYSQDFTEMMMIVRMCLTATEGGTIDGGIVQATLNQLNTGGAPAGLGELSAEVFSLTLREAREVFEREYLGRLMKATGGDISQAAKQAGLDRTYLYRRMRMAKAKEEEK